MKYLLVLPGFWIGFFLLSGAAFAQTTTAPVSQTAPAWSPFQAIGHTEYIPHTELFAECRPLIANRPGRFTAHPAQSKTPSEATTGEIAYAKGKSWFVPFATAPVSGRKKILFVPQTALLTENGNLYVHVQTDPEHFRKRAVQTGKQKGDAVGITGGLKAGGRIVTVGGDEIK